MNEYDKQDLVRVSVAFTDDSNVAQDPTTITVRIGKPDGTSTLYTYGVDSGLVKDGTGAYHIDVVPDQWGIWPYRWVGTGAVEAAEESAFYVKHSAFD